MPHRTGNRRPGWIKRALSLLLAAVLLAGTVPGMTLPASAHWADEYLDQLVDWGVMRSDQIGNPDTPLTRAEFMAIINRAYGYNRTGPMPFTDVQTTDWFYDDISIAYNAGYMAGTSPTTADPNGSLTREMAACILARNMMMKDTPAESLAFSDSRDVSDWARGLVKTAVDHYVISGYPDNSFGPQKAVTKGEMAVLITRCVGNPLNQPGEYELGDVFDNVTITTSGVTLRNTTISGDLYVSAGVGLGNVKLENVRVLGRVIVSGTGESEKGDASVVMRNVTANEMLVDNMRDQLVTLRAEGLTQIGQTVVRTPAYLEDNTPDENGLRLITLEGGSGARLDLAGRIKEVVSQAPRAAIKVAKGTVQKLTVDEHSTDSTVQLDRNTQVKELNTDVASSITGDGDVDKMNINSSGVTSTVLPDDIYIRPGLNANVDGEDMDSAAAEESSRDPKILSGYPIASDIAPTSFRADFATNKRGTVYWAVSSITDGSVSADHLISPPSYGSAAVKNGSVAVPSADTVVKVPVTGLTVGGSYYLSAVLVDNRGERSPVKVISFTTPDNSKPAFAQGYPYMSLVTDTLAQVTVMPTKSCKLYYAVLPAGAKAPTVDEMRSAAVTGNLGYGVLDVVKNTERTFTVSRQLEELKDYVLYLWLSDADGVNSSNIQSLRFKTVDTTPPLFNPDPSIVGDPGPTNVNMNVGLNEPGTVYWVVVPRGSDYPRPNNQSVPIYKDNIMSGSYDSAGNLIDPNGGNPVSARLESEFAKLQVRNGRNATRAGSVRVANADTDVPMNITGLVQGTAYDLYYVAQDAAGNFSAEVKRISINTQDSTPPVVRQYFTPFQGDDETKNPMANSTIILQFNESITAGNGRDLLTLYEIATGKRKDDLGLSADEAKKVLEQTLSLHFKMYSLDITTNVPSPVLEKGKEGADPLSWVDYSKVIIRSGENGIVEVVFPGNEAVSMASGSRYYFELTEIRDEAGNQTRPSKLNYNEIGRVPGSQHVLPWFDTVFAQVDLAPGDGVSQEPVWVPNRTGTWNNEQGQGATKGGVTYARVDTSFLLTPRSTQNADPNIRYDIIILTDAIIDYDLYYRIKDKNGRILTTDSASAADKNNWLTPNKTPYPGETNGWIYLGNKRSGKVGNVEWDGMAINRHLFGVSQSDFPYLTQLGQGLEYEFAISVTDKDTLGEFGLWDGDANFRAYVVASGSPALQSLTGKTLTPEAIKEFDVGVTTTTGRSIGIYGTDDFVPFQAGFQDQTIPPFTSGPSFRPGDTFLDIDIALKRKATIYYVIAPREKPIDTHLTVRETAGSAAAGDQLESMVVAHQGKFWDVIKAQTDTPSPGKRDPAPDGELEGDLRYYRVNDSYPPSLSIVNAGTQYPNNIYGSFDYDSIAPDTIHIDGNNPAMKMKLLPNQDYYIYMVVKGTYSERSKVYIYNFHTDMTSSPKITLTEAGLGAASATTHVEANLRYALFNATELGKIPMFSPNERADDKNLLSEYVDSTMSAALAGSKYADYKVIDALCEHYRYSASPAGSPGPEWEGYSVFDAYANSAAKSTAAGYIRNNAPGAALTRGNLVTNEVDTVKGGNINHISEMDYTTPYYCLAVAYNVASSEGVGDTFGGLANLRRPNTVAPSLDPKTGVSTEMLKSDPILGPGDVPTSTTKFTGIVTITFNNPVYWVEDPNVSTGSAIPVAQNPKTGAIGENDKFVGILQDMGGTATTGGGANYTDSRLSCTGSDEKASSTFKINFEDLTLGSTIILFNQGYIANSSGYGSGRKLQLTLTWGTPPSQSGISSNTLYFAANWIEG